MENNTKKNNTNTILIVVLAVLLVVCIGVTIWAVFFRKPVQSSEFNPDYPPQETEPNQTPIHGGNPQETLHSPVGGGAINLTYGTTVTIDISEEKATFYFANPAKSNLDMVMTLVIDDTIVMISKRITPGHMVSSLKLESGIANELKVGGYDAKYVVYLYDRQTGEKAIVNAEGAVTVTVVP